MTLTPEKLASLREAIAALQADDIEYEYRCPWYVHHLDSTSIVSCRNCDVAEADDPVVANYIAAADPQTVLGLLDEVERLTRERDEARASFASICRHSDEQRLELDRLRKSPLLSRLDEFAKAALTGICTTFDWTGPYDLVTIGSVATQVAQATIRAIDGAGGA